MPPPNDCLLRRRPHLLCAPGGGRMAATRHRVHLPHGSARAAHVGLAQHPSGGVPGDSREVAEHCRCIFRERRRQLDPARARRNSSGYFLGLAITGASPSARTAPGSGAAMIPRVLQNPPSGVLNRASIGRVRSERRLQAEVSALRSAIRSGTCRSTPGGIADQPTPRAMSQNAGSTTRTRGLRCAFTVARGRRSARPAHMQ
jgi:hypothetical protein